MGESTKTRTAEEVIAELREWCRQQQREWSEAAANTDFNEAFRMRATAREAIYATVLSRLDLLEGKS